VLKPVDKGRREFAGYDGGSWVADVLGPADAPTVLLLHGGGQTRHAWGGTALALASAGYRAVALDLPGHGESAWSVAGDYRIDTLAQGMSRLWGEIGTPLAVVGASLGGLISMTALGLSDAPPIAALALVDVAPRLESVGVDRIVNFRRAHPDGFATLDDAARHISAYRGRPVAAHPRGLQKNLRLNKQGRWVWHWDQRLMNDENHSHRNDRSLFERALQRFDKPVLLVRGDRSDVLTEAGAQAFLETFPNARYVNVRGAGHMVAGDANDAFTAGVVDFLGDVMPASLPVPTAAGVPRS
jgi:pimeloyl-ACP methyl ester carboxylesterase